jgi:hypothetical protein
MYRKRSIWIGSLLAAIAVGIAHPATAGVPANSDCVAQFDADFHALFPGFTIGQLLGAPGSGAAHTDPLGSELHTQATSPPDSCFIDLTP